MSTNHPYRRGDSARTVITLLRGRVCDLPPYVADGLVRALEEHRNTKRSYDVAYSRARRAGTLGREPLVVSRP